MKAIGFEFEREKHSRRGRVYLAINDAKRIVHPLRFNSGKEYTEWARGKRSDLLPFPNDLPRRPELQYKDDGWEGWPDFIGPTWSRPQDRYLSFEHAREFVRGLGLKTWEDWFKFRKGEISGLPRKPANIPAAPEHVYKEEWVSIYDWLGTSPVRVAQTDQIWREMHDQLVAYKERFGDCNVPRRWSENPKLANWVGTQRNLKSKGKLSEARISKLDDLGFMWRTR